MGQNAFPFRRITDPFLIPVDVTPTQYTIAPGYFDLGGPGYGCESFLIINPNLCWVRIRGSGIGGTPFVAATATTGLLLSPGQCATFSVRGSVYYSCLAITRQGIPAMAGDPVEIFLGNGA